MKTAQIITKMSPETKERFEAKCKSRERSMSEVICSLVIAVLDGKINI